MAKGIDVYTKFQTVRDWRAVRGAGYEFAYVKVTDGVGTRATNGYGPAGRAAGVKMGGYHFVQYSAGSPEVQARHFIGKCTVEGLLDLAPALDMEDNPPGSSTPNVPDSQKADWTIAFCREVIRLGHRPAVYCNNSVGKLIQAKVNRAVTGVIWWIARYGKAPDPVLRWDVWQHSDAGKVAGITATSVDLNEGIIPLNRAAVAPIVNEEEIMTGVDFESLPYSGNHPDKLTDNFVNVTFPCEAGTNSSIVDKQWVTLNSAWGDTDYELILVGANGTLVAPQAGNGFPTNGTLNDRERAVWQVPSGCEAIALRYKNNGAWVRCGIGFPQRTK